MGYQSCHADWDLWLKPAVRPSDGPKYYAYVLLYVDDCLAVGHDATTQLEEIDNYFAMKAGSIGDPDLYLGGKLKEMTLENGVNAWAISSSKYVQEAVSSVQKYLDNEMEGRKLAQRAAMPMPPNYDSIMDVTPMLPTKLATFYQSGMR